MTQQPSQPGISHLRCSDEDRELIAQVLNNAYADGRLDYDEHSDRIAQAYNAKTFADLDGLTLDLIPPTAPPTLRAETPTPSPSPSFRSHTPATGPAFTGGNAILSNFRPGGPLSLPEYTEITCLLGDVRLDLVGATFLAGQATIRVNAILGEVRIRVPAGVRVVDNVSTMLGDYKSEGIVAGDAAATLIVEGTSFLADVKVLGPDVRPNKYEKFV